MREGNFNRVERAERVEKGLGVSSQKLGLDATTFAKATVVKKNTESAKPWPMVRLGDVCEIKTGKKDVNQGNPKGKYPFFTCARTPTFSDTFSFDCEALLIAGNGDVGFTQKYIGKFEAYQRTYVLSNFRDVDIDFLYCILVGLFRDYAGLNRYGSSMPYIKMGVLKDFIFPLPPIEVQKEIVERLEKELGEVDKVAAEFKRMAELADTEFKAELDEVFGGLGNGVCGQELVSGEVIAHAKSAKFAKADVESQKSGTNFFNAEKQSSREAEAERGNVLTQRHKGTEDWPMVRLGDVGQMIRGRGIKRVDTIADGRPCIRYGEIYTSFNIILDRPRSFVSDEIYENSVHIKNGDLVFTLTGENKEEIGKTLVYLGEEEIAAGGDLAVWSDHGCNPKYLSYVMYSSPLIYAKAMASNGQIIVHLSVKKMQEIIIPLPSLSVQKEIVAKLDAAKERCEKLKAEAERGLRAAENLRKAILSEAFE